MPFIDAFTGWLRDEYMNVRYVHANLRCPNEDRNMAREL